MKTEGTKTTFTIYNNVLVKQPIDYSKFEETKVKQNNEFANVS